MPAIYIAGIFYTCMVSLASLLKCTLTTYIVPPICFLSATGVCDFLLSIRNCWLHVVYHWNDYFNALIYNNKAANAPLQTILREILLLNQAFQNGVGGVQGGYGQSSADQVKYAVIIVSTVPILVFYPFVQKYFEKGVMIGAVKG